ncbi:BgTH12-07652 [Blumeria graminis f. sp. triticale]|uniref:BgTH12-07652 n=1 Tax=Blumeria graminis f. sp. triticale TaxID=1689686 RepID=A0A9W4CXU2_BLUGR|nr:BgTH12-07652 [Blumeria graminis f. sp. triticale]
MIACSVAPALLQPVLKARYSFDVLPLLSGCY